MNLFGKLTLIKVGRASSGQSKFRRELLSEFLKSDKKGLLIYTKNLDAVTREEVKSLGKEIMLVEHDVEFLKPWPFKKEAEDGFKTKLALVKGVSELSDKKTCFHAVAIEK